MAVERKVNPLPRGVYWQDVFTPPPGPSGANIQDFLHWSGASGGKVEIIKSHTQPGNPSRLWALFEVHEPLPFFVERDGKKRFFGQPTKATRGVEEKDTAHNTPTTTADAIREIGEFLEPVTSAGASAFGRVLVGAGVVLGGYLLLQFAPRRGR